MKPDDRPRWKTWGEILAEQEPDPFVALVDTRTLPWTLRPGADGLYHVVLPEPRVVLPEPRERADRPPPDYDPELT